MRSPDLNADPEAEPYRFLGIDPTGGPDAYVSKDEIEDHAKELIKNAKNKGNKTHYTNLQIALKKVRALHPDRSQKGTWRVPMEITPDSSTVEYDTEITVKVTDFLGNPIPEVSLRLEDKDGQRIGRTESDGTDSFTIGKGTGDFTIIATKNADRNKVYVDDSTTVTVERRQNQLHFDEVPSTCTASDEIDVRIVDNDGNPVPDAEVHPENGSADSTDADGWATPTVDESGSTIMTAKKSDTRYDQYYEAKTSISVKKHRVSLEFGSAPDVTQVGKREVFRIIDGDGNPIEDVQVTVAGKSYSTSKSGRVEVEIPPLSPGKTNVTASKQNTPGIAFTDTTTTVDVEERTVDLSFVDPPDEVTVGDDINVRVVDEDGNPVSDVVVTGGSAQDTTNDRGRATLTFQVGDLGRLQVTATQKGLPGIDFDPAKTSMTVVKRQVSLQLSVQTASPTFGDAVGFRVTSADGEVEEAIVQHRSLRDTTNESGSASLEFESAGRKTVVSQKKETSTTVFESDRIEVDIERQVRHLDLVPPEEKIEAHNPATFTVQDKDGRGVAEVKVDGEDADVEETDRRGEAEVTFRSPGSKRVRASKSPTDRFRFVGDSLTTEVRTPPKSVTIAKVPDEVSVGDSAKIQVIDHRGNPLPDAVIKAVSNQNQHIDRTDEQGGVEFTFQAPGFYTISASKDGFDIFDQTPLRVDD